MGSPRKPVLWKQGAHGRPAQLSLTSATYSGEAMPSKVSSVPSTVLLGINSKEMHSQTEI